MGAALCCCSRERNQIHQEPSTSVIRAATSPPPIGRLLIFVNPNSGSGQGVNTFYGKVVGSLEKNNIDYELIITNGPNHARSIVSEKQDLLEFNGIVILSGDGLVYEVLNGLCSRSDAGKIIPTLPIAVVPSGSGNGLLASVFASKNYSLKNPAFTNKAIIIATSTQAEAKPVNLLHVQTTKENIGAFLSIGWGLMADIDIESEKYRKTLGSNRFTVSALIRCMRLRTYKGKLSYKLHTPSDAVGITPSFAVYQTKSHSESQNNLVSVLSGRETDKFWTERQITSTSDLHERLEDGWTVIKDEFIGVYAMNLSHIAADGHFMPGAKLDDDKIYLTYILKRDVTSKAQLVKMLLRIEKGSHIKLPFFHTVHVSSFRLEPEDKESLLVVDGEIVDTPYLQATVTDLKTAIFT